MAANIDKASDNSPAPTVTTACFSIPLPGGRVARIPQDIVEKYIEQDATVAHAPPPRKTGASPVITGGSDPKTTQIVAGDSMITINIYSGQGEVAIQHHEGGDDVVAHSLSVDAMTGSSEYHTDWELGECEYTDDTGFPQRIQAWHRHPFGTEYSEIYEG